MKVMIVKELMTGDVSPVAMFISEGVPESANQCSESVTKSLRDVFRKINGIKWEFLGHF